MIACMVGLIAISNPNMSEGSDDEIVWSGKGDQSYKSYKKAETSMMIPHFLLALNLTPPR